MLLVTPILLLFVELNVPLLLTLPWLFEPGPVVPMVTLPLPDPKPLKPPLPLVTPTVLVVPLLLLAEPLEALPPLVLPDTLALPLEAPWLLLLPRPIELLLV